MKSYQTDAAPAAIGPYAQAVSCGRWLFTSGQIGLDPATGELVEGGIEAQTRRVLDNLRAVLDTAGCRRKQIVKTTIYLTDMAFFAQVNELYGAFVGKHRPARSTVAVAGLPKGALVEIDLVVRKRKR